jgi:hypothetical protein
MHEFMMSEAGMLTFVGGGVALWVVLWWFFIRPHDPNGDASSL